MLNKIWLKSYPEGVPQEINPKIFRSLVDLLDYSSATFSQQPAVSNFGSRISYIELNELTHHFAAYLQQTLGLKKGERFAIMLPNIMQYYVAMFGALRAGLVVVNVNPQYTVPELLHQLADAEVSGIIVMANFAHNLEQALAYCAIKHVIITEVGDLLGPFKSSLFNWVARYIKKLVPRYFIFQAIGFKKLMKLGKRLSFNHVELSDEDTAYLQYTGGTTGISKGAILTHGNMVANVEQATVWIKSANLEEGKEVLIAPLPLYHIFSLTACALSFIRLGGESVLITDPRDTRSFLRVLARNNYTVFIGINTLFNSLLQKTKFRKLSFKSLKLAVTGGMPLHKNVAQDWLALTDVPILEGYGLTEAGPIVTVNPPSLRRFTGSIGLPLPSTEMTIRDLSGKDLGIDEEGELCIRGPQVMKGYWHNEEETKNIFTSDGYLKTGDIVRCDDAGFFYIIDRKKDMILVSGFNVYPNELESVISMYPKVLEVAVVGVSSSATGEAIKAFIVKKDPSLTEAEILDFCRKRLTGYKIPRIISFIPELPKSNIGKVLKRELVKTLKEAP